MYVGVHILCKCGGKITTWRNSYSPSHVGPSDGNQVISSLSGKRFFFSSHLFMPIVFIFNKNLPCFRHITPPKLPLGADQPVFERLLKSISMLDPFLHPN